MKQLAVILIALSVTFNVAVPRHLDSMVNGDTMNQAMRCQSVLLYYSFFSVLPIKIMNALFTGQPDAAAQDSSDGQSDKNNTAAPNDLSVPGKILVIKTACVQSAPGAGALRGSQGAHVCYPAEHSRWMSFPSGWSSTVHQWMVMLPRGSIDDHIKTIITNLNKPIGIHSQLAFSFGGHS